MTDYLLQGTIGLVAGILGGLLGIGGATIIIPSLIFYMDSRYGRNTWHLHHLRQAAAMICNIFIAIPAVFAHLRAKAVSKYICVRLIPSALTGSVLGVTLSNSSSFAHDNSRYLGMILSGFMAYVVIFNIYKMCRKTTAKDRTDLSNIPTWIIVAVGIPMGTVAGLLGIGGGSLCVPAQQLLLRVPLKNAIANSAVTIMCSATIGAIYKNITLSQHGSCLRESLTLAACIIPTAIIGSLIGGRLTHLLPQKVLRIIFILFMLAVSITTLYKAIYTGDANI